MLQFSLNIEGNPIAEGQELLIQGEDLLCYSLFANLIKNACEASSRHSTIGISIGKGQKKAEVRINNEGVIPDSLRNNFFEKYATADKTGGTGLGTYSAKLMAETQNGSIAMESSSANGTTLIVCLPLGNKN